MRKSEQRLLEKMEALMKDKVYMEQVDKEMAYYKLRFGNRWMEEYIKNAGMMAKDDRNKLLDA